MPDKLLKHGLTTSPKIGKVPEFAELLFVRLILATCHAGRCPWNPDWIRSHALPNRPRKRLTEIAAALETLRRAHLVARYTGPDGTAYLLIPNHGQRLKHAVRSPWPAPPEGPPDAEGQTFMALPGNPIAAPPPPSGIGKKPKACVSERTHFTSLLSSSEKEGIQGEGEPVGAEQDQRLAADCLAELVARYPRHDVPACLRAATRYVRKARGEDADVSVGWFIVHWMPKAAERKESEPAAPRETPEQRQTREAEAALRLAEQRRRIEAIQAGPEPADGTLEHAIWTEARRTAAA
jgi:hypothetical protein